MAGRGCQCARTMVFKGEDSCAKCGKTAPLQAVVASTWRLSKALAEIALNGRRHSDGRGQHGTPR